MIWSPASRQQGKRSEGVPSFRVSQLVGQMPQLRDLLCRRLSSVRSCLMMMMKRMKMKTQMLFPAPRATMRVPQKRMGDLPLRRRNAQILSFRARFLFSMKSPAEAGQKGLRTSPNSLCERTQQEPSLLMRL